MAIKTTIDDILSATEKKSIQEFKGKAKISDVSEYKSQQSGKTSIKVEFDVDGAKFSAYSGLTENSIKITLAKLVSILYALVGKAKTRDIFENIANDEETESEAELAIGLATEARKKLLPKLNEPLLKKMRMVSQSVTMSSGSFQKQLKKLRRIQLTTSLTTLIINFSIAK